MRSKRSWKHLSLSVLLELHSGLPVPSPLRRPSSSSHRLSALFRLHPMSPALPLSRRQQGPRRPAVVSRRSSGCVTDDSSMSVSREGLDAYHSATSHYRFRVALRYSGHWTVKQWQCWQCLAPSRACSPPSRTSKKWAWLWLVGRATMSMFEACVVHSDIVKGFLNLAIARLYAQI